MAAFLYIHESNIKTRNFPIIEYRQIKDPHFWLIQSWRSLQFVLLWYAVMSLISKKSHYQLLHCHTTVEIMYTSKLVWKRHIAFAIHSYFELNYWNDPFNSNSVDPNHKKVWTRRSSDKLFLNCVFAFACFFRHFFCGYFPSNVTRNIVQRNTNGSWLATSHRENSPCK